jgi:hypothetical protein
MVARFRLRVASRPGSASLVEGWLAWCDARVAELVDAAGLNPAAPQGAYRFKSCPGHRRWIGCHPYGEDG